MNNSSEMTREQVWELYGGFLIEYTMEIGWDELVRSMSPNLKVRTLYNSNQKLNKN